MDDRVLFFLHIPKAAGTSLREIIADQYRPEEIVRVYDNQPTSYQNLVDAGRVGDDATRVVMGHFSFGFHELSPRPVVYASMIRHPVQRALSHYLHSRRDPRSQSYALAQGSVERYVAENELVQNWQLRLLVGMPKVGPGGGPGVPHPLVQRAVGILDARYVTCGVADRFEESIRVLAHAMGWRVDHLLHLNPSPEPHPTISASTRRAIERANEVDLELYEHVSARLDRDLAHMKELGVLDGRPLPTLRPRRWKLSRFLANVRRR